MKKKPFNLSGILKVRQYRETVALQEFMQSTQRDRELANQLDVLNSSIEKTDRLVTRAKKGELDIEQARYAYNYINYCSTRKKSVQMERYNIQDEVAQAREKYNRVRLELESIKILENAHNKQQKKLQQKKFYDQIQEGAVL